MAKRSNQPTENQLRGLAAKHGGNWFVPCDWTQKTRRMYRKLCGPIVGRFNKKHDYGYSSGPAYKSVVDAMTPKQLAAKGFTPNPNDYGMPQYIWL